MRIAYLLVLVLLVGCAQRSSQDIQLENFCRANPSAPGCERYGFSAPPPAPVGDRFDRSIQGLPDAGQMAQASPSGVYQLSAEPVQKLVGGSKIRMFGYNGMIPGPIIRVRQGSTLMVNFTNHLEQETTVHWHGLRLENRNDGVPGVTQEPVEPGDSFLYNLSFPDAGLYWYHPHVREDYQQELGLYGLIVVEEAPQEQEVFIVLDDIAFSGGDVVPSFTDAITHVVMGRFGNQLFINGQTPLALDVIAGEPVRVYALDAANVRPFKLSFPNASMRVVAQDNSYIEAPREVASVILGPSERVILDVTFPRPGSYAIWDDNPDRPRQIGTVKARAGSPGKSSSPKADPVPDVSSYLSAAPDLVLRMDVDLPGMMGGMGMMMHGHDGIEWEDSMPMMAAMTNDSARWKLIDAITGKENMDIRYMFERGQMVKIRLVNSRQGSHPMQHPIHIHGNRFVVLSIDGVPNADLAWKDTVLVPMGATVDILLEASNPGEWMVHCHIAEHLQSGMMTMFEVR